MSKSKREVWVVESENGPLFHVINNNAVAFQSCRNAEAATGATVCATNDSPTLRVVKYVPAPTTRRRKKQRA